MDWWGIAGGILGALGGKMYSLGGDGLFRIPAMINLRMMLVLWFYYYGFDCIGSISNNYLFCC